MITSLSLKFLTIWNIADYYGKVNNIIPKLRLRRRLFCTLQGIRSHDALLVIISSTRIKRSLQQGVSVLYVRYWKM